MGIPVTTVAELGTYILPGKVFEPTDGPRHAAIAEQVGFGSVWLSDRWEQKEVAAMLGAVAQATSTLRFGTSATHPHTRHPLVLAGMATTLQALSGGRFTLGLGRSAGGVWQARGLMSPTTRMLRDIAVMLKQLWAGEVVTYDGPLGNFPALQIPRPYPGAPPALALAAMGPNTLDVAGSVYDEVLLHPFLTTESTARAVARVRAAAEAAGRNPEEVRIAAQLVAAPALDEATSAAIIGGRAVTYLQTPGLGELIVEVNGWPPGIVDDVRNHSMLQADLKGGLADWSFTLEQLSEVAKVIPKECIDMGAAVGDDETTAGRARAYVDAGADEVILHAATPDQLAPLVDAYRRMYASATRAT